MSGSPDHGHDAKVEIHADEHGAKAHVDVHAHDEKHDTHAHADAKAEKDEGIWASIQRIINRIGTAAMDVIKGVGNFVKDAAQFAVDQFEKLTIGAGAIAASLREGEEKAAQAVRLRSPDTVAVGVSHNGHEAPAGHDDHGHAPAKAAAAHGDHGHEPAKAAEHHEPAHTDHTKLPGKAVNDNATHPKPHEAHPKAA